MFTSLKVVRIAAVACDCTRRSATRSRRRDIGTRCSGRPPRLGGSGTAGALASGCGADGGAEGLAVVVFASTAPNTSPLVIRPPRPVPVISFALTPSSAISFRADGMAEGAACGDAAGGGDEGEAAAGAGKGDAAAVAPAASVALAAV